MAGKHLKTMSTLGRHTVEKAKETTHFQPEQQKSQYGPGQEFLYLTDCGMYNGSECLHICTYDLPYILTEQRAV